MEVTFFRIKMLIRGVQLAKQDSWDKVNGLQRFSKCLLLCKTVLVLMGGEHGHWRDVLLLFSSSSLQEHLQPPFLLSWAEQWD